MLACALAGNHADAATFDSARDDFRDESIYFVMTTRFYDGDPANNVCGWDWQAVQIANNDPDWRGDFAGLIQKLDYIKALGFTAVWITPVVQNCSGTDFHGYHAMDFQNVDLRYESRAVFLIRIVSANDISAYDVIQNLFPDKNKDFVFNITESDIVLVKELKSTVDSKDLEKLARSIADTLSSEFYTRVNVGIGTAVVGVKDLARSFKEAQMALEVGKVFDTDKVIVSYDNLGIARLIYHLPTTLCETFLHEVFKVGSIDSLDHETLFTIQKFFENNLNVSETSRKLFVHRNTLVYRLEKIKKLTGLDLREFDHAIIFKIALMVKKYLSANPVKF